jgi:hypothetical protein
MPIRIVREQSFGFCCGQQTPIGGDEHRRGKANSRKKRRSIKCRSKLNCIVCTERVCEEEIFRTAVDHLAQFNNHILSRHMPIEEVAGRDDCIIIKRAFTA